MENEQTIEVKEEVQETEVRPEDENTAENLPSLIDEIRKKYEEKIAKLSEAHNKELAERDTVIKQLLTDDDQVVEETIADKINKKRNYKKW